ncbi:MAG: UDP-2,3-diacylglucosamine diphosphatase [Bacteroidetes bacterium]|nr:UDP-2,3-diacylglucosamine diphosphatase [Bacteroidota bacterium]
MLRTKRYFISDIHLGIPDFEGSLKREKLVVEWLEEVHKDALEIYLLGDIFDVWMEYKRVVPRGFTRFLGKIADITDSGIPVHYFAGNHDQWITDYLPRETGVILHRDRLITELDGKRFFLAHGDGLGPSDKGYKRMKAVFRHPVSNWLYSRFHPNFGIGLAAAVSYNKRNPRERRFPVYRGEDGEWLILYAKKKLQQEHFDYFIFGHRHIPINILLKENCRFINLGDWLSYFSYAVYDGSDVELKYFRKPKEDV